MTRPAEIARRSVRGSCVCVQRERQAMARRSPLLRGLVVASAALVLLGTGSHVAESQRQLSWPEVVVEARLDADGRLHVRERQVMLFNGDWNGGQRSFTRRRGQELELESLERIDPATGVAHPLVRGDLSRVDEFDWTDGNTVRWRSRLPSDPPFVRTAITYVLVFTYDGVLQPGRDGTYLLDHDFTFSDREGVLTRFELTLDIDPAWGTPAGFTGQYSATSLPRGQGYVVTVPLTRVAAAPPAGVRFGSSPGARQALAGVLAAGLIALFGWLIVREVRLGRAAGLTPTDAITAEWLNEHVFAHLPEVVGAEWDNQTAAPEVAAVLARLVQERKISSTVKTKKVLMFEKHVLHLRLEVPRERFQHHERALIDALFASHETSTDTERVRERYKSTGFDPAVLIRPRLTQLADGMTRSTGESPSRIPTLVLLATSIALLALGLREHVGDAEVAAAVIGMSLPVYLISAVFAYVWRGRVTGLWIRALGFVIPLGAAAVVFTRVLLLDGQFVVGSLVLAGLVVWMVALANSVFNFGRSRESPGRIARRKRLASAREYFRRELGKAQPALRDAWFPYVLAFGLGRHIDRWFRAFGSEAANTATRSVIYSSGASGGSTGGGSWSGFGGGGGFGGAGGGASFGAAIGGMAAAVPSPGSSSSGGGSGGGGGGSSGGGGGGGW